MCVAQIQCVPIVFLRTATLHQYSLFASLAFGLSMAFQFILSLLALLARIRTLASVVNVLDLIPTLDQPRCPIKMIGQFKRRGFTRRKHR
jgi:hypothetical protein